MAGSCRVWPLRDVAAMRPARETALSTRAPQLPITASVSRRISSRRQLHIVVGLILLGFIAVTSLRNSRQAAEPITSDDVNEYIQQSYEETATADQARVASDFGSTALATQVARLPSAVGPRTPLVRLTLSQTDAPGSAPTAENPPLVRTLGALVARSGRTRLYVAGAPGAVPGPTQTSAARTFTLSQADLGGPTRLLSTATINRHLLDGLSSISLIRSPHHHHSLMWIAHWGGHAPATYVANAHGEHARQVAEQ
jgi:hypothetical protein